MLVWGMDVWRPLLLLAVSAAWMEPGCAVWSLPKALVEAFLHVPTHWCPLWLGLCCRMWAPVTLLWVGLWVLVILVVLMGVCISWQLWPPQCLLLPLLVILSLLECLVSGFHRGPFWFFKDRYCSFRGALGWDAGEDCAHMLTYRIGTPEISWAAFLPGAQETAQDYKSNRNVNC